MPEPAPYPMPRQMVGVPAGLSAARTAPGSIAPSDQVFRRTLTLRRLLFTLLVAVTTFAGGYRLFTVLNVDGWTVIEFGLLLVFSILFSWITLSFWLTCFGFFAGRGKPPRDTLERPASQPGIRTLLNGRTAIIMPIYNEDIGRTFRGLRAICASLVATGQARHFDVLILSDSNRDECQRAEEEAWQRLRAEMEGDIRVFYRRRPENVGRKSGNIEDFCTKWGSRYDYMVVLDADSLMTGDTLVQLVRLMDANSATGLIQVPPTVVGQRSLFARIQQFSSSVYGPVFAQGLAYLQGPDGNYWGHNAIIRVRAFMDHCGLPILNGAPPLGGEILSHDFVEAALMRRAGWDVWMMPELSGSYEETPPTVDEHLARDRRWCQGNLQHAKLLSAADLKTASRLHLLLGVMSYVSSPLWLILLVLSIAQASQGNAVRVVEYLGSYPVLALPISHYEELLLLFGATFALLFGPKIFGLMNLVRQQDRLTAHGGAIKATASVLGECVFSILFAPVAMLAHSWFVLNILMGRSVEWTAQQREDNHVPLAAVVRTYLPHTVFGALFAVCAYVASAHIIWWLAPFLAGLLLSVPVVYIVCAAHAGHAARRAGLFLIPSETKGVALVDLATNHGERPAL